MIKYHEHTSHQRGKKYLSPEILLRVFRALKSEPKRIFISKDLFVGPSSVKKYLQVLVSLGLVKANVTYKTGKRYLSDHRTKGYQLK